MGDGAKDFPGAALRLLRCPLCGASFSVSARSLCCLNGHSYDVARRGYVNLLPGGARPGTADTAEMVAAREAFLAAGHFSGLRHFISDIAERAVMGAARASTGDGPDGVRVGAGSMPDEAPGCIMEIGAGTGYYLAAVLDRFPARAGLAMDISKFAARRAARAHERMAAIVCDAWSSLPVADACALLVLDVFAPRNPAEFRRALRPDGALVVVTPSARHLTELIAPLGLLTVDERKPERLDAALAGGFTLVERNEYEQQLFLSAVDAGALAAMGPSAHHLKAEELAERVAALGKEIQVTLSVVAWTFVPRRP
jgi:23S rRNA (guanine745-N1)-methyltransferase